jgi:hypothetical protein
MKLDEVITFPEMAKFKIFFIKEKKNRNVVVGRIQAQNMGLSQVSPRDKKRNGGLDHGRAIYKGVHFFCVLVGSPWHG